MLEKEPHEGDVRYSAADAEAMEAKLSKLEAELEMYVAAFGEEKKQYGKMLETTNTALEEILRQAYRLDTKLDKLQNALEFYITTAGEEKKQYRKTLGTEAGQRQKYMLGSEFSQIADRMAALFAKAIKAAA
jgi:predicted ATP-dependent protease